MSEHAAWVARHLFVLVATLLLLLGGLIVAPLAEAQAQATVVAPSPNAPVLAGGVHKQIGAGLAMTIDASWLPGPGYRPVRVNIVPTLPPVADRTLTFEFVVGGWGGRSNEVTVLEEVEIPAGSGPIQKTILVPPSSCTSGYYYRFRAIEDGRTIKGLSNPDPIGANMPVMAEDPLPRILFIVPPNGARPATTEMAEVLPVEETMRYGPNPIPPNASGKIVRELPTAQVKTPGELAARWIDYTVYDLIALSLDDLAALRRKEPEKFQAIVAWTAAGGNLIVWGVGAEWQRLGELESLVGLAKANAKGDPAARAWQEPDNGQYGQPVPGLPVGDGQFINGQYVTGQYVVNGQVLPSGASYTVSPSGEIMTLSGDLATAPKPPPLPSAPEKPPFLFRPHQMGLVVALAAANPFPGKKEDWAWVFTSIGTDRLLWNQRHGLSLTGENPDFWQFLIPGVGLAPVGAFGLLITVFVLAIGPLNYWFLRRWKRLHLLIVTVPLAAGTVTLALFGYAIVADGLGTRVRARSVTLVDQARGQAACWSRLSYYCGLAPRGGLRFPEDVAVYPWEPIPGELGATGREFVWQDDQWFSQGWLSPRTPTQFLTVRSRRSQIGLEVVKQPSGAVSVRNRLGTGIQFLLLRTEDGKFHQAEAIEAGADTELQAADFGSALSQFAVLCRENSPGYPPGVDAASMSELYRSRNYRRGTPTSLPITQESSRMERTLKEALWRSSASGWPSGLMPRGYIAVVDRSPETVLGTPAAQEEASLHVIFGTW